MKLLRRLDAHFGTARRFEVLLCWCLVVALAVGMTTLVGCMHWGEGALYLPDRAFDWWRVIP